MPINLNLELTTKGTYLAALERAAGRHFLDRMASKYYPNCRLTLYRAEEGVMVPWMRAYTTDPPDKKLSFNKGESLFGKAWAKPGHIMVLVLSGSTDVDTLVNNIKIPRPLAEAYLSESGFSHNKAIMFICLNRGDTEYTLTVECMHEEIIGVSGKEAYTLNYAEKLKEEFLAFRDSEGV